MPNNQNTPIDGFNTLSALTGTELILAMYSGTTVNLTLDEAKDYILNLLDDEEIVTGGTYNAGTATFTNKTGGTFTVTGFTTQALSDLGFDITSLPTAVINTNVLLPDDSYVTYQSPLVINNGYTLSVPPSSSFSVINPTVAGTNISDIFVTGGTYSNGTTTFTNNTGGTFTVTGFNTGSTEYWTSGSTGNYSIKANNNSGLDATNNYAVAEGYQTKATGDTSHAEGYQTIAGGGNSHSEGYLTTTIANNSHAEGSQSVASGNTSHAEGFKTTSGGNFSHAEGTFTTTIGDGSHAEGKESTAIGQYSHAEGKSTTSSGSSAHAEGESTTAIGNYSHAEGLSTTASGTTSHSGGYNTKAIGDYSFVHGYSSQALNNNTIVLGSSIIGSLSDTVYVNNLVIDDITTGTSVSSLGVDSSGKVISGNTNISEALYTVNADLSANNTTTATTSVLIYGVNVFTGVTPTDYATKLPQPVTGKSVKVINNGNTFLYIFPSNIGGRVNNLPINTPAIIPPDGNLYEFICIKNPDPGMWTFSAPATGQYDSGEITMSATSIGIGSNPVVTAIDSNAYGMIESYFNGTVSYNGKNKPAKQISSAFIINGLNPYNRALFFRPETPWKGITKIKVYTNLITAYDNEGEEISYGEVRLMGSGYYNKYVEDTGQLIGAEENSTNELFRFSLNKKYDGSATSGSTKYTSANIGDDGTIWGEKVANTDSYSNVSIGSNVEGTFIGNKTISSTLYSGTNESLQGKMIEKYYSSYITFQFNLLQYVNYGTIPDFKIRFVIEYY